MSYYPEFADYLNDCLMKRDRSGSWLAKRLDVNPSTVARWLNGQTRPRSPELVSRIADVLGIYKPPQRYKLLETLGYAYPGLISQDVSVNTSSAQNGLEIVIRGEFCGISSELLAAMRGALAGILSLSRQDIQVRHITHLPLHHINGTRAFSAGD